MKKMHGNMFNEFHRVDHFIVCAQSELEAGKLPMTLGEGLKLATEYPDLTEVIGNWINDDVKDGVYLFRMTKKIGLFQNMFNTKDGPSLRLISAAAKQLKAHAEANKDKVYALEAPVYCSPTFLIQGIMETLPDNVEVWYP